MATFSTQSPGLTDASAEEQARLESASSDAYIALSKVGPDSPEYASLNAAALQASINLNKFEPVYQPVTHHIDGEGVSTTEYHSTRLEAAVAGEDTTEDNIVGNVEVGRITPDEPFYSRQLTEDELLNEQIIANNIAGIPPPELRTEEQINEDIIAANIAAQDAAELEAATVSAEQQYAKDVNQSQRDKIEEDDWRVRLHLAPDANYLYKAEEPGILAPLNETKGIIFPYTPEIAVQYNANYENYDLIHSNYRGYFYTGSVVQNLLVTATFTANDVAEANYMLATMHFLRSATKMFYGQDDNRGMPPPVVFLSGLGEYQFKDHPCAITMFNYNLPNDVDYIPCGKPQGVATKQPAKVDKNATSEERLKAINVAKGAKPKPAINAATRQGKIDPYTKATYVPTKITMTFTMIPIQTRDQISKDFSLRDYASGKLLKGGFW